MVKNTKAQAAFEYLTTYGWAILTALIVVGALSYFGFLNPSNLLPNKCDFGKQLECVEYRIQSSNGVVSLMLRNNFGKDIDLTYVEGVEETAASWEPNPLTIPEGQTEEFNITLGNFPAPGEKKEVSFIITFERSGGGYQAHNLSGVVFVTVQ